MKKILTVLLGLFIMSASAFADEFYISSFDCVEAEHYHDREISLKYDDEDDIFYLYQSFYSSSYWFTLTPAKLELLRKNIAKAQEWTKLARENKTKVTKQLPDSTIKVPGAKRSGNDWYTTRYDLTLDFFFISVIDDSSDLVTLMIRGDEEESRQNQFIDIEFESVIFLNDQIDAFAKAISEETIQAAKQERLNEKKTADLFN